MHAWCSGPVLLVLAGAAQATPPPPDRPPRSEQPRPHIWRELPGPIQDSRIAVPVAGNFHIGVGRFSVLAPARPRTHTEPIGRAGDIARRNRGIAAVGLSLRF
jgi:hypothetical protein